MKIDFEYGFERRKGAAMPKFVNPEESMNAVCKIYNATVEKSSADSKYIAMNFDIVEGEDANIYQRKYAYEKKNSETEAKWKGVVKVFIPETDDEKDRFNRMLDTMEEENEGFCFTGDTECFENLIIGVKLQATPYETDDGKAGYWLKPKYICSAERVRNGKEKVLPKALTDKIPVPYVPANTKKTDLNKVLDDGAGGTMRDLPDEQLPW